MAPAAGSADEQEFLYGLHAVREALAGRQQPLQRLLVLRTDQQFTDLVQLGQCQAYSGSYPTAWPAFDRLVPDGNHQGVVAFVSAKAYSSTRRHSSLARQNGEPPFLVILDGVEDPQNLGAVFRRLRRRECTAFSFLNAGLPD